VRPPVEGRGEQGAEDDGCNEVENDFAKILHLGESFRCNSGYGNSFSMHNRHIWTERTEDGDKREVRAIKFGGVWRLQSKLKSSDAWIYHDPPLLEDLIQLRDILFRKYQRRRASYEDLVQIEKMITARGGTWKKKEE